MSNLTSNPLIINQADVAANPLTVWKGNIHVYEIEFANYTADTDTCVINLLSGQLFWKGNGAVDLKTVRSGHLGWAIGGLVVPTGGIAAAGTILIYYK